VESVGKNFLGDVKTNLKETKFKNMIPGTLVYRGNTIQPFHIECYDYDSDYLDFEEFDKTEDFIKTYSTAEKTDRVKWINITGLNNVEEIRLFSKYFGISDLQLEQVLYISNHSFNEYNNQYIFNDIQMVYANQQNVILCENISIYKVENIIITFQEKKGNIFNAVRMRLANNEGVIRKEKADYLYYSLLDAITDFYLVVLEIIGNQIELLEEKVVNLEKLDVKNIHEVKKKLMILKLSAIPIEKMVGAFIENEKLLKIDNREYLLNLHGHIKEVVNEIGLQKEYIDALFENYVLNNSDEMNSTMTTLTIFSAIFIPLSFLAGVFGMNFTQIPGLDNPHAFTYFLIGCGCTTVLMLTFFKIKKWF
jgi:magnesium transporter